MSLDGIADFLFKRKIPSPKGRDRWTQPVLGDLLSNQKYIGYIVSFDDFFLAHGEKSRRSNIDEDTHQRKATRYNSQSVLSGLLVCAECGCNYRRITRPSGEIVWRCASRVEHGKKFCQHSPSISEDRIKEVLCEKISFSNRGSFSEKKCTGIFIVSCLQGMKLQKWLLNYKMFGTEGLRHRTRNPSYPLEIKREAVAFYPSGQMRGKDICKNQIQSKAQFKTQISLYHGQKEFRPADGTKKGTPMARISVAEKQAAAEFCIVHDRDYMMTAERFGFAY